MNRAVWVWVRLTFTAAIGVISLARDERGAWPLIHTPAASTVLAGGTAAGRASLSVTAERTSSADTGWRMETARKTTSAVGETLQAPVGRTTAGREKVCLDSELVKARSGGNSAPRQHRTCHGSIASANDTADGHFVANGRMMARPAGFLHISGPRGLVIPPVRHLWLLMAKTFTRLVQRRAAAYARVVKASEALARAEEAYWIERSPDNQRRVMQAKRALAEARAAQMAARARA